MKYSKEFSLIKTVRKIDRNRKSILKDFIFIMQVLSQLTVLLVNTIAKLLVFVSTPLIKYYKGVHKDDVVNSNIKVQNVIELKPYLENKQQKAV